jgi:hypothetical protein
VPPGAQSTSRIPTSSPAETAAPKRGDHVTVEAHRADEHRRPRIAETASRQAGQTAPSQDALPALGALVHIRWTVSIPSGWRSTRVPKGRLT